MSLVYPYGERRDESHDTNNVLVDLKSFKPYLKERKKYIHDTGRHLELDEELKDIEFYLEVIDDHYAVESMGLDLLSSIRSKLYEISWKQKDDEEWTKWQHEQNPNDKIQRSETPNRQNGNTKFETSELSDQFGRRDGSQPLFPDSRITKRATPESIGGEPSWFRDDPVLTDYTQPAYNHWNFGGEPARPPICMPIYSNITAPQAPLFLASMHPTINVQAYQIPHQYQNPYYGPAHYFQLAMMPPQTYQISPYAPDPMAQAPHYNRSEQYNSQPNFESENYSADYDYYRIPEAGTQQRASLFHKPARKTPYNRDRYFNQSRGRTQGVKRVNLAELEEQNTNTPSAHLSQRRKVENQKIRHGRSKKVDLTATMNMSQREISPLLNNKNEKKKFSDNIMTDMQNKKSKKTGAVQREPTKKECTRREANDAMAGFSNESKTERIGSGVSTTSASRRDPTRASSSRPQSSHSVHTARKSTGGGKRYQSMDTLVPRKRALTISVKTSESEGEEVKASSENASGSQDPKKKKQKSVVEEALEDFRRENALNREQRNKAVVERNDLHVNTTLGKIKLDSDEVKVEPEEEVEIVIVKEEVDLVDCNPEDDYYFHGLSQEEIQPGASEASEAEVPAAENGDQETINDGNGVRWKLVPWRQAETM